MKSVADHLIAQRSFTAAQRRALADKGQALPDGSYPVPDADALRRAAILAKSGHGDVAAAKKLIAKRAKQLGVGNPLDDETVKQDAPLVATCPTCGVPVRVLSPETKPLRQGVIIQVDSMRKVMHAVIQAPNVPHYVEISGEPVQLTYTPDCVRQMAWDWLTDGFQDRVSVDHAEITQEGITPPDGEVATMVESYVAPVCFDIRGRHISQGSWVGAFKFHDDEVWDSVLAGKRNAPSLTAPLSQVEFSEE